MSDERQLIPALPLPAPPSRGAGAEPDGYRAYFERFNAGEYFDAHEVLEPCWLRVRGQPLADFYKALIQLAGAWVHLKKQRHAPATRLLDRAAELLGRYPPRTGGLDLDDLNRRIKRWRAEVTSAPPSPRKPS